MVDIIPSVFKIQRYSIHDGPGIRTTLFFQGCPPESQAMEQVPGVRTRGSGLGGNKKFTLDGGESPEKLVKTLIREIEKDQIFYDESGGGVTFSGGEPLSQPELLLPLIAACRERDIHTCLDTSGFAPFRILKAAATKVNLVLFDIKLMDDQEHLAFTGKPAKLILENLKQLSRLKVNLKLRFPLIPCMTDTKENINQIIEFLTKETIFRRIHILPFHNTGQGKYEILEMKNELKDMAPPTDERVEEVVQIFELNGFQTTTGG